LTIFSTPKFQSIPDLNAKDKKDAESMNGGCFSIVNRQSAIVNSAVT
jgi:hypothetical protein